jgi:hypothetical protein
MQVAMMIRSFRPLPRSIDFALVGSLPRVGMKLEHFRNPRLPSVLLLDNAQEGVFFEYQPTCDAVRHAGNSTGRGAAAPAGGALVSLSGGDPVTVPASVTVPAGSTNATFTISTRAVGGTIPATIGGSYGGVSASARLSVTRPTVATASFGVTGPTETDTCTLTSDGGTLNCTFDGHTSTAPGTITTWDWSWSVATTFKQTTSGPVLTMPAVNCNLLPPPPLPPGNPWFTLIVKLKISDNLRNVSPEVVNPGVRLLPQGACGFS